MGIQRWLRKCKRRKGGIYLWRTRKHAKPWRRENGYVGETRNFTRRQLEHMGQGGYGAPAKDWSDLDPICYKLVSLPWWLCWKWVLRPLETLAILVTWPRYNVQKNRWNPRHTPLVKARAERAARDTGGFTIRTKIRMLVWVRGLGILTIMVGLVGAYVTRGGQ
jgi:hypothetical protein